MKRHFVIVKWDEILRVLQLSQLSIPLEIDAIVERGNYETNKLSRGRFSFARGSDV